MGSIKLPGLRRMLGLFAPCPLSGDSLKQCIRLYLYKEMALHTKIVSILNSDYLPSWCRIFLSPAAPVSCKTPEQVQRLQTQHIHSGGSLLTDFIKRTSGPIKDSRIHAIVRSEEQAQRLAKLEGVNVIQTDLGDEARVREAVLRNEINIVVHIASSMATNLAENLLKALGKRQKAGAQTYFIQASHFVPTVSTKILIVGSRL
jgi:hypothetical protein